MAQRTGNVHDRRGEIHIAAGAAETHGDAAPGLHALQLFEEVDVEISAAELAIGNAVQAEIFLEAHDVADGRVFYFA